jgi:hypothetical protein
MKAATPAKRHEVLGGKLKTDLKEGTMKMFTVTPAATRQIDKYFQTIAQAPIRIYYSSGG